MGEFVEVKTAELEGVALDYCHLHANGKQARITKNGIRRAIGGSTFHLFNPTSNSGLATEEILRHGVRFDVQAPGHDFAARIGSAVMGGSSFDIAACRAIVAAKLGDTVSIPRELLP